MITTFVEKHPNAIYRAILIPYFVLVCWLCSMSITVSFSLQAVAVYFLLVFGAIVICNVVVFWIMVGIIRLTRAQVDSYFEMHLPLVKFTKGDSNDM